MSDPIVIDRPPRIQPELPFGEREIPSPPDTHVDSNARLIQIALPLVMIVGYVLVSLLGNGQSLGLLIPMAISVAAAMAFSIYSYRRDQAYSAEAERAYAEQLTELHSEMVATHEAQRRFYRYNYPAASDAITIAKRARAAATQPGGLRNEARLWERRVEDTDFGVLRLGMGTLPSTVTYELSRAVGTGRAQARDAQRLADASRFVSDIPVIVALRPPPQPADEPAAAERKIELRPPVCHALALAGQPDAVYAYARALLAHAAAFHAPTDAKIYLLAGRRQPWAWAEDLPHARRDDEPGTLTFFADDTHAHASAAPTEDEGNAQEQFLERLRRTLAQRKLRLQERDEHADGNPTVPFLMLMVDLLGAGDPAAALHGIASDAAIAMLLADGAALGAAVIFLVRGRGAVPGGCGAVIEVERSAPAGAGEPRLYFRYAEVGLNTTRYVGLADTVAEPAAMAELTRAIGPLEVQRSSGAGISGAVPLLGLMGYGSLAEFEQGALASWRASTEPGHANWLKAKLGRMAGNKPRTLIFSAKRDGVHGMVAGSTGSGKSELLISLITAMAASYDPATLNFVLVDYKGGGAFEEFRQLPHCVDLITNLNGDGVTRMFTAIQAEMRRRQELNARTGTRNIVEYRQRGLHLTHQPYPFLFIIIDEFAEMIADRAEFKSQLESITRVGRAQGVSLILAAQRPSGVTDQMRSNIKFRICLRVETPGESREMLRRIDAAFLPPGMPGRGYLQVGNEQVELIQVAYAGDTYADPGQRSGAPVIWPARGANHNPARDVAPPELYKVLISALGALARQAGAPPQLAPWPAALPRRLALSETLLAASPNTPAITSARYLGAVESITMGQEREPALSLSPAIARWLDGGCGWVEPLDWARHAMRPVVGLIDDPAGARQLPLVVELPRGHAVVFGASGWGKTTFLRSLITSLAASHAPGSFHAYILDLGGRGLGALGRMPHVGAVITPDEAGYKERVEQLLRELETLVAQRKALFAAEGAATLAHYNDARAGEVLPAVLVAVDNFVAFTETFGEAKDNVESMLDRLIGLARQSKPFGLHFAISAGLPADLPGPLGGIFTERFALKLADAAEYRAILGAAVSDMGDIPGRGYTLVDQQPLRFQVAVPFDLRRDNGAPAANEARKLELLGQAMHEWLARSGRQYALPIPVDVLPSAVLLKQLLARQHGLALGPSLRQQLRDATRRQWAASADPAQADWLSVAIGLAAGNRPRVLRLDAQLDGVHGMVAGGTGSGKSELLMSLIVGLALSYDPSILNFVLVDYKGGGAFKPFARLPHCVDLLTNLNAAAVRRMFTAIEAEIQRRQQLNAETNTKNIVHYRQRGLHLTHQPYPHLFIIIDEYAEMISENPDFQAKLDSITRVGRAQGINLLLAAQRPKGVSDQMRANIKLRICLRVEQADTSRELLRRSDAALLPNTMPGRGYIQAGNDAVELIQVAYTGEKFEHGPAGAGDPPAFYDLAVELANELLAEAAAPRPRAPWPPFLPAALSLAAQPPGDESAPALHPELAAWATGAGGWPALGWQHAAMRATIGLIDDPYHSRQLPLTLDLARGHAVLFGASGWGKTTFLRTLALSVAASHAPGAAHIHILDLGGRNLDVLRALPHVGTVILPDEPGFDEQVQQLWRELGDLLDARKRRFADVGATTLAEYNAVHPGAAEPAVLVLIDNIGELIELVGDGKQNDDADESFAALAALARHGKAYGLHFAVTASRLGALPGKLYSLFTERLALRLANADEYSGIVGGGIDEIEELAGRGATRVGRRALLFQIAQTPRLGAAGDAASIRELGERMRAALGADGRAYAAPLRITALPDSVSYRQVLARSFGIGAGAGVFFGELAAAVRARWARNAAAEHAGWLEVTLGVGAGERDRTLVLSATRDGVHGMVAGGTGSGKSELLMTLIVGLALNYDPSILNFVLVDYKGGGAFKPFARLPHCVDIVTNLNKAAVQRMFTAIEAEIRRRQQLNAETKTKDIVHYRQRGLHLTHQPYPHLFIIIDEYAEMIDDNPEYRQQLESITRVGRAQGINLLLASQRPKGVTDQMRANIKLRICLRVEQTDTSRELLRRPDAALLPGGMPGRGYIQVGNDAIELIQVAYSGEDAPDTPAAQALWPGRPAPEPATADEPPKLFGMAAELARALNNGRMAPRLWPSFLPTAFSLAAALGGADAFVPAVAAWVNGDADGLWPALDWRAALRPTVGLADDPAEARQAAHCVDLSRAHLAVFGDAGSGKTTFLRALLVSLAATHAPWDLHLYALDLGGRGLRSIEALPHMGAVIYADELAFEERLQRLLELLTRTAEARQQTLSEAGATGLADFNTRFPERALPAVVVAIDNVAELHENHETLVESALLPLARRALGVGIAFVVAGNTPNNLPGKLLALFGERMTFRQSNTDRYLDIVGRGAVELDDIAGRGYVRAGRRPLMFQAALPAGAAGGDGPSEAEDLARMAEHMRAALAKRARPGGLPAPIRILPEEISLAELLHEPARPEQQDIAVVLGRDGDLLPFALDLRRDGPHLTIVGPPLAGKTTVLRAWALALAERYTPAEARLVLLDTRRKLFAYGGRHSLADLPHVVAAIGDDDQAEGLVALLEREAAALAAGAPPLFVLIDNADELGEELERNRELSRRLVALVRRCGPDGMHFIVSAGLGSGLGELRRRIQLASVGIGLRTAAAVEALGVVRTPAGLRDRTLPAGRGYVVRSGQAALIQIATPFPPGSVPGDTSAAQTLDAWVERVIARYAGQRAAWSNLPEPPPAGNRETPPSAQAERMRLVLRGMLKQQLAAAGLEETFADGYDDESLVRQFEEGLQI